MRITKKAVSLVLAILMVTTMMSVMAVSTAFAATISVGTASDFTEALGSAASGDTIVLNADITLSTGKSVPDETGKYYGATVTKNLTIDGANHTVTFTTSRGFGVKGASGNIDVVFKDITIVNAGSYGRAIDTRGNISSLTLDNAKLYADNTGGQALTIGGNQSSAANVNINNGSVISSEKAYAITTFNPVNMTLDNSTITGWACLNIKGVSGSAGSAGSTFTVTNSTLNSESQYAGDTNDFSAIKIEDNHITVNITDSQINISDGDGKNSQAIVSTYDYDRFDDVEVTLGDGNTVELTGEEAYYATNFDANEKLEISGGTFNKNVPVEYLDNTVDVAYNDVTGSYDIVDAGATYVARVGNNRYTTLQGALDYVPDGGTVTVLQNISNAVTLYADGYVLGGNRTYTVDLGGYTVSGASFSVADGNNVTFTNGTITSASVAIQNAATTTVDTSATVISTVANHAAVYGMDGSNTIINGTVEGNKYGVFLVGTANGTINGSVSGTSRGLYVQGTGTADVTGKINAGDRGVTVENGATVNLNDGAEVTAPYGVVALTDAIVNVNEGSEITSSIHAISGNGTSGDGGYEININGGTITATGDQAAIYHPNTGELNISGGTIASNTASAIVVKSGSTEITGGTITSDGGEAVKYDETGSGYAPFEEIVVSGGTFSSAVPVEFCAEDYYPVSNGGSYTVDTLTDTTGDKINVDGDPFNMEDQQINDGAILGVQLKSVTEAKTSPNREQENGSDIRFVGVLSYDLLKAADDYGFVLAKADAYKGNDERKCDNTNFDGMKYNGTNGEKTISAVDTKNNLAGEAYGDPTNTTTDYKFVTCAVNSIEDGKKIVARFYVKVNGKVYYMNYGTYSGCVAGMADVA